MILTVLLATLLLAFPAAAEDKEVAALVAEVFDGEVSAEHGNVVIEDTARKLFWAFHIANYLDVIELRVYMIPYASADPSAVRSMLSAGDSEGAFESLLSSMNLSLGAMFIADVGLNGIHEEPVAVGAGQMRDSFHRQQFADHAAADKTYRQWLDRAVTLKNRTS
jgi:hypothetical protein